MPPSKLPLTVMATDVETAPDDEGNFVVSPVGLHAESQS